MRPLVQHPSNTMSAPARSCGSNLKIDTTFDRTPCVERNVPISPAKCSVVPLLAVAEDERACHHSFLMVFIVEGFCFGIAAMGLQQRGRKT